MTISNSIQQRPSPGQRILLFRGDVLTFRLTPPDGKNGSAWLRTNIGRADITREETIRSVQENLPPLSRDWFDFPMHRRNGDSFEITLPLCEIGHFEAKCFFLCTEQSDPIWPPGPNTEVNVEPADTCCANILYNAFVRQFGPNKAGKVAETDALKNEIQRLDDIGYTVIPPSGTFRDLIGELDFILGTLGCRFIQLLPIHPTPTTYARMGRFGSPYAALSFTGVDPSLAQFDPHATPMEQFTELVDAVHRRHGKLILDIAINHTGWAAELHYTHPEWLDRGPDGRINVPGAWGVQWEDLTKLDYRHSALWQYMADMFLTWCRRGADGFRCDAGYMIPVQTWKYLIAKVRTQYPDTLFFLEGLGGKISVTRELLNFGNFNWAYSELFQNYTREQIESYLPEALQISRDEGLTVHYAETHDNLRLAATSKAYARLRTDMCALFSPNGAFGFANGVEWFATEKLVVHQANSLNWGAGENQVENIARLTALLKHHPAFHDQTELTLVQTGPGNHVAMLRHHRPSGKKLLIIANLDSEQASRATWQSSAMAFKPPLTDLLTGALVAVALDHGSPSCRLEAGQVVCLSPIRSELSALDAIPSGKIAPVPRIIHQRLRAKALEVFCALFGRGDLGDFDPSAAAQRLAEHPESFCQSLYPQGGMPRVVSWQWPRDNRRVVMVPPAHFLLVLCDVPFCAQIMDNHRTLAREESLPAMDHRWFALFLPQATSGEHLPRTLQMTVFENPAVHTKSQLLILSRPEHLFVQRSFIRSDLQLSPRMLLLTNGIGGMSRAPVLWGRLQSRYDGLLAANSAPDHPVDRWVLFSRCRAWVVFQGFSQEITFNCFHSFYVDDHRRGVWRFHVPTGQGEHIRLTIELQMTTGSNEVTLTFYRHPSAKRFQRLTDDRPVRLILRPDLEHRNFHATTKAYMGPETAWPAAVYARVNGFSFTPDQAKPLLMEISRGEFKPEPEWQYMVNRPKDAERGFDPDSDLFSPGYFQSELAGDTAIVLTAKAPFASEQPLAPRRASPEPIINDTIHAVAKPADCASILKDALSDFVVTREKLKSVIAGYPWFLDWGRDALIFARGLISIGKLQEAKNILIQFGRFEENGTLPNMISGAQAANRDTSDAPLWFIVAVADLLRAENNKSFLASRCGNRTMATVLVSIANAYVSGTPNGICMDKGTGLIFSPAHFTWMDTNHPAGTPREGYPIEIQALWYHALELLARVDPATKKNRWRAIAKQARTAILRLFFMKNEGFFSDCLHAAPGVSADVAEPDDALRPNQLLTITLGAVTDEEICHKTLSACETLLVPGAIRSLADRPVKRALPILLMGQPLNNPHRPYMGNYTGDEDTRRKPAYHNGTAWTWPFPAFCEAWSMVYGKEAVPTALAWLGSSSRLLMDGCIGHLPEILDGDAPHTERGCDAQAWSDSEWIRVWHKLTVLSP
ncbi:MAG: amylo-alpha-1,6-glucosidase [Desulfobacterales bacterium]|jgi:predicted glycogen debranching enzyme|nr:amylo-alpha-1,6-glucosidase [Desulfobacterales bacterium]